VTVIVDNCLGINSAIDNSITISLNPCEEFLNISIPGNQDRYRLKLMNITGAVIYENEITTDRFIIDMIYPSGVYFVSIQSDERQLIQKVIH